MKPSVQTLHIEVVVVGGEVVQVITPALMDMENKF